MNRNSNRDKLNGQNFRLRTVIESPLLACEDKLWSQAAGGVRWWFCCFLIM